MAEAMEGRFYDSVPLFAAFEGVADEANYRPLPDGWLLAVADIVNSTGAIADGRYKTVNMAGASVISALMNVLEEKTMPFVFGGMAPWRRCRHRWPTGPATRWLQ